MDWTNGEFVGLVWFSSKALESLKQLKGQLPSSLRKRHLSEYIEFLRTTGLSVAPVDVAGDWAEFNEPRDIAHFVLGTKAETLSRLHGIVRQVVTQDQITFSVKDWNMQSDALKKDSRTIFRPVISCSLERQQRRFFS